jgi:negative regulator of flagellin synthesis FlgM
LTSGLDGQIVQARTASGQLISGIAKTGGVIEVAY